MPGPSIEIVVFTAFVVVQLALKFCELPLWQSMLSGVTKVVITGAGPEGGDVAPDELCPLLCPLPVEAPPLDGIVVEAELAAFDVVVLAALPLPDEHPPARTVPASARLTTATRLVDMYRRPAGRILGILAVVDFANMVVPPY
jgi:hypothetical protein